ncbi:hypothetical protein ABIQ69_02170 [Agromyces sp. G08B096]|uniref:Uncharacterized protein n=1 Tax=Agromyces sp. G08B096 TaxID=3156399 RepID=A0AAU7W8J0_9MICO
MQQTSARARWASAGAGQPGRGILCAAVALALALAGAGCATTERAEVASLADGTRPAPAASAEPSADVSGDPVRLVECVAEHGIDMPMPVEEGTTFTYTYPEDVAASEFEAALAACDAYLPGGGEPADTDPETISRLRELAECMRAEGIAGYPDPGPDGIIRMEPDSGIDVTTPEYQAAQEACAGAER